MVSFERESRWFESRTWNLTCEILDPFNGTDPSSYLDRMVRDFVPYPSGDKPCYLSGPLQKVTLVVRTEEEKKKGSRVRSGEGEDVRSRSRIHRLRCG